MTPAATSPFDSEAGFRLAVDAAVLAAAGRICVFDRDLAKLRFEERQRVAALRSFVCAKRDHRIRIAVQDTRHIERKAPRLLELLRLFGHAIEVRRTPEELDHLSDCQVLSENGFAVVRFHVDQPRGKFIAADPTTVAALLDRFGEIWATAEPCALTGTLGL